jgi:hypothetical protein
MCVAAEYWCTVQEEIEEALGNVALRNSHRGEQVYFL